MARTLPVCIKKKLAYANRPTCQLFFFLNNNEGEDETVRALLEGGRVNLYATDTERYTLFHLACLFERKSIAELLLDYGASADRTDDYRQETALHTVASNGSEWYEILKYIVEREPHLIERRDRYCATPLHNAASSGSVEMVKYLLEKGADVHARTSNGLTPLGLAAEYRHREVVILLLNIDEGSDSWNLDMQSALRAAAFLGWIEVLQCLMRRKPDLNARLWGTTALQLASKHGQLEIVKYLVEQQVDIDARSEDGDTALISACVLQELDIVEYLLKANANCDIPSSDGYSPLFYLVQTEEPSIKHIKLCMLKADLMSADYEAILDNDFLTANILQDVEFCCKVIVNKYNNYYLRELYELPAAGILPKRMDIVNVSAVFKTIQRDVRFEIETKGHCNLFDVRPKVLKVLCVKSLLKYGKKL